MKQIICTIDYELFFGEKEGSVNSCMIKPTELLADIVGTYDSNMTVFWDILHYWKLKKFEAVFPQVKEDAGRIEEQIIKLANLGHDIQLHLHPHWLNTNYDGRKWQFNLEDYRLHCLTQSNNKENIKSIAGCVREGKELIEKIIQKSIYNSQVNTFRAGGYCIQPFDQLSDVFRENGIFIDSSACFGIKLINGQHSYDFTGIPQKLKYRFNNDINIEDPEGMFIEFPIGSIRVSGYKILYWAFLRRAKYKNLRSFSESYNTEKTANKMTHKRVTVSHAITKSLKIIKGPNYIMLTPDNFFREKFDYLIKNAPDGSVMILHPKYLNQQTIDLLEKHLKVGDIRFCSIKEKMANNE